ncbi:MAG: LysR family transcriptional regulator [Comamonadaceae bacterium]|nr:MAG: LysR family transcriptional regulator [Comamonadaceae bacterium]
MHDKLVELRTWQQFVAVAEELHFTRAAQRLHMTQPPVTQAIAQLEQTLNVRLFNRTQRRVELTASGQALLPRVRALLFEAKRLPALARQVDQGEAGSVRLAFVSTVGFEQLPGWVRDFRIHCPEISLELVEATGDVQLDAFAREELDAGLVLHSPREAPSGLERFPISIEPMVLALYSQHPLAQVARPSLLQVLAEPLVFFPRRILPSVHDAVGAMYRRANRVPIVVQEAIQMQTIVNLVSGGVGVAWVPRSVMRFQREGVTYRESGELRLDRVTGGRLTVPECETSLVWANGSANAALPRFLEFIRSSNGPSPVAQRTHLADQEG